LRGRELSSDPHGTDEVGAFDLTLEVQQAVELVRDLRFGRAGRADQRAQSCLFAFDLALKILPGLLRQLQLRYDKGALRLIEPDLLRIGLCHDRLDPQAFDRVLDLLRRDRGMGRRGGREPRRAERQPEQYQALHRLPSFPRPIAASPTS